MVDLTGFFLRRISSIGKRPFANVIKDLVEPCFADKESIMLGSNLAVSVHEIEVSAVVGRDDQERPPTASEMEGPRSRQGISQCFAISPQNRVIEIDGHPGLSLPPHAPLPGSQNPERETVDCSRNATYSGADLTDRGFAFSRAVPHRSRRCRFSSFPSSHRKRALLHRRQSQARRSAHAA